MTGCPTKVKRITEARATLGKVATLLSQGRGIKAENRAAAIVLLNALLDDLAAVTNELEDT